MTYEDYIQTEQWRLVASAALKRDGFACVVCLATESLEGHHVRYPARYEDDCAENIQTLCSCCHTARHRHNRDSDAVHISEVISRIMAA